MITPNPGYIVDPNNSNGVIRDPNISTADLNAGNVATPKAPTAETNPVAGYGQAPTAETNPVAGGGAPIIPPGMYQDKTGKVVPVDPPTGYHRTSAGDIVQDTSPVINREVYNPGTTQNMSPNASTGMPSTTGSSNYDTSSPAEKAAKDYLDTTLQTPKTEEQIIADRTAQSKDRIKALNDYYLSQKESLAPVNDMRLREANAQAVMRGLSGSSEAGALTADAMTKNATASKAIEADHAMKMADLYSGIQDFAHNEAIRQKSDAMSSAKDILARKEENFKIASDHLATIAQNPSFNLDVIKQQDPTTYNQLAQSVGGEDIMKGIVFAKRPQSSIVGTPAVMGTFMHQTIKMPDGTIKNEYNPLPKEVLDSIASGKKPELVETPRGTLVSYDGGKNLKSLEEMFKAPAVAKTTKVIPITRDMIATANKKLSASVGTNKYIDPNVYQTAFEEWVKGTDTHAPIGTAKEFLTYFPPKNYVDPATTSLPDYLMPAGSTKTTTSEKDKARF